MDLDRLLAIIEQRGALQRARRTARLGRPLREALYSAPDSQVILQEVEPHAMDLFIAYESASGEYTERLISAIRLVRHGGNGPYLVAMCHERDAPRSFTMDGIIEATVQYSGEVLDTQADIMAYIESLFDHRQNLTALRQTANADLTILAAASRVDGQALEIERDAAVLHLDHLYPLSPGDAELAALVVDATSITCQTFRTAIRHTLSTDLTHRRQLARSLRRVCEADGRIAAEEHDMLGILLPALQA